MSNSFPVLAYHHCITVDGRPKCTLGYADLFATTLSVVARNVASLFVIGLICYVFVFLSNLARSFMDPVESLTMRWLYPKFSGVIVSLMLYMAQAAAFAREVAMSFGDGPRFSIPEKQPTSPNRPHQKMQTTPIRPVSRTTSIASRVSRGV